jgi:hypothetical protein
MKTKFRISAMLFMATALAAMIVASCSKDDPIPPPDLTALKASIAAAQAALDAAVEGKADGQYPTGSKAALQAAITAGQSVVDSDATVQAQADAAKVSVDTALTTFQGLVIKPIAEENLVAHWTFDEGTGTTANDASANHFNGTFKAGPVAANWHSNMPTWTADRTGAANKALHFNGGSVEVPYNTKLNPTQAITVSVWVNADTVKPGNRFLGLQSWIGYKYELQEGHYPFFTMGWSDGTNTGSYDRDAGQALPKVDGNWYQLATTFVPGKMTFYINGVKVKEYTDTPNPGNSISGKPYNLTIGQDFPTDKYYLGDPGNGANFNDPTKADQYHVIPAAWGGFYQGSLDELRIYNIALSDTQVAALYAQEKP